MKRKERIYPGTVADDFDRLPKSDAHLLDLSEEQKATQEHLIRSSLT